LELQPGQLEAKFLAILSLSKSLYSILYFSFSKRIEFSCKQFIKYLLFTLSIQRSTQLFLIIKTKIVCN